MVEWPVNRCPLRKVWIGRGKGRTTEVELQSCVAFPVNTVAISTQSHRFPMYIYIYIHNTCFVHKYVVYVQILNIYQYIHSVYTHYGTSHWKRYSSNLLYFSFSLKLIIEKWEKVFKTSYYNIVNNDQIMLIGQYAMWFEKK